MFDKYHRGTQEEAREELAWLRAAVNQMGDRESRWIAQIQDLHGKVGNLTQKLTHPDINHISMQGAFRSLKENRRTLMRKWLAAETRIKELEARVAQLESNGPQAQ